MPAKFIAAAFFAVFAAFAAHSQTISGTVTDPRGAPVAGATVELSGAGRPAAAVATGSDGRFAFPDAANGQTIRVAAAGFAEFRETFAAVPAEPFAIILQPAPVDATVNVTVTRIEETEPNASVAVITVESLGVTAARTADDTLRQMAGFQLFRRSSSRTMNPTAQGANLRGIAGSGASRATVLYDGLSLNDAFGGWTYWSRVPMIAVEQIEVFSGGASSFYGSGGMTGAVNIVPKDLRGERFRLNIETSGATQNTADMSGILLFSKGKWQADLIGDGFRTGGYIPVEEVSRGSVDAPAASRHANAILKLSRRFGGSGRVFVRGNRFAERRENGTVLTNNRTSFRQLAAGADWASQRYGEWNVRAFGEWQVYDQTFSAVAADRNSETLTRLQRVPSRAGGASLLWQKKFGGHTAVASAEILQTRGFSDEIGFFNGRESNVSRAGGEARDLSLFVQDKWEITPKLVLNLSGRMDFRQNSDGIATARTVSTGSIVETRFPDRRDPSFSPRIAATYDITDAVAVYASFSRSFRAPSLNELYRGFRVGSIVTEANPFLTPERAATLEAGGSVKLLSTRFITRASFYSTRVTDPVVSVTTSVTPSLITRQRQNLGSTLSRGFEISTQYWHSDSLKLNASYLFADAKISDFPADPSVVGNRLPQTARHSFTAQARYELSRRWNISTQIRASSSQFEDDRNTLRLRSYFTADVRTGFNVTRAVEAFVSVENILNSRYDIGVTPVRTVAAPASVRIGLRFRAGAR